MIKEAGKMVHRLQTFVLILLALFCGACSPTAGSFSGKVVGVADGDTIDVMHDGQAETIRLWGVDCPEKAQAFGSQAKKVTSGAVFGRIVAVENKTVDRYGRTVGEVTFDNEQSLNRFLVENGSCWWYEKYAPDDKELKNLEIAARLKRLGLWRDSNPVPPWVFRRGGSGESQSGGTEAEASIVGNRSSKVYHLPGCPGYNAMKEENKVFFQNEKEAQQAGFRKARNCD